jgi:predicted ATPase/DNA-binding CsgD family transcriptional regulator
MAERRHNLPVQPTPLIGREREVRASCELLVRDDVRLVTLTGPGGTGKTRVGIEVASRLLGAFPNSVVFVGLASIDDPGLVVPTIAQAVGVRDAGSRPVLETLQAYLREQRVLLLLDNFEQILPAAPALAELLATCADLKILVTSRAPLHVRGEREYPVPPLPLPSSEERSPASEVAENPAVMLFVQRATDVQPEFRLTDENADAVAEICRRLDGLPLAIELAAARIKLLPLRALLSRLERRLPLLTGGPRDAPERQRTLRDTIAWSYDLLDELERALFRRLSVFVGGCTIEAAEAVCGAADGLGIEILDGIASLVDKSLFRQEDGLAGEPRVTMLETIREFGLERLAKSGEEMDVRRRHLRWCLDFAESGQPGILGAGGAVWMDRFSAEIDNVRSALTWSLNDHLITSTSLGLRLASAQHPFWFNRDLLVEGGRWLEQLLSADAHARQASAPSCDDAVPTVAQSGSLGAHPRVAALNLLGIFQQQVGNLEESRRSAEEALALAQRVGDRLGAGHALIQLGVVVRSSGEYGRSLTLLAESAAIFTQLHSHHGIWRACCGLGETRLRMSDPDGAKAPVETGLAAARSLKYIWGTAQALRQLGVILRHQGDVVGAIDLFEESLDGWTRARASRGRSWTLVDLGQAYLIQSDLPRAAARFSESLVLCQEAGDRYTLARCLEGLGEVAARVGTPRESIWSAMAAQLLGAAMALRATMRFLAAPAEQPGIDRAGAAARARLGEVAYVAALAEGRALPLPDVVELGRTLAAQIQAESLTSPPGETRSEPTAALTPREREVAVLIGRGYSNRQIGETLVIAEKTAEVHARNVRAKLGLSSRAQIAAWAAQHGLLPPEA